MIIIIPTVLSQLITDSPNISRTKSIITYCSPLFITVDLNTDFILEIYHTRKGITAPDPCGIYNKIISKY